MVDVEMDLFGTVSEPEPVEDVVAASDPAVIVIEPEPNAAEPPPALTEDSLDPKQAGLFGDDEMEDLYWWKEHWEGMPDFDQQDMTSWKQVPLHFESPSHFAHFAMVYEREFGKKPTLRANWWPPASIGSMANKRFVDS